MCCSTKNPRRKQPRSQVTRHQPAHHLQDSVTVPETKLLKRNGEFPSVLLELESTSNGPQRSTGQALTGIHGPPRRLVSTLGQLKLSQQQQQAGAARVRSVAMVRWPHVPHSSCSSTRPTPAEPSWSCAAPALQPPVWILARLCVPILYALLSEIQTPYLGLAEDRGRAGEVPGCLSIRLAPSSSLSLDHCVFVRACFAIVAGHTPYVGGKVEKGTKIARKGGCVAQKLGKKLCCRI